MLSVLIPAERGYPAVPLARQPVRRRFVQLGPLVLESDPRKFLTPTADRDRTVSRRSEPSSRATLMGEQPNPWDLLQPRDVTSRHRGAKPLRRYDPSQELISTEVPNPSVDMSSWEGSACYPRSTFYPLSDGPSTRYHRITLPCFRTCSTCRSCSQPPFC